MSRPKSIGDIYMDTPKGYVKIEWDSEFKDSRGQPFKVIAIVPEKELDKLCEDHCLITKMCNDHKYIEEDEDWDPQF